MNFSPMPSPSDPSVLGNSLANLYTGRDNLLCFDFRFNDDDITLHIMPGCDQYGGKMLRWNIGNKFTTLPDISYSFATTTVARLDGLALAASTSYLVWAMYDQSGTNFVRFAITRKPSCTLNSASGATEGATGTFGASGTGMNNMRQFTTGAHVIIRNNNGITDVAPNGEFNQGRISAITSNTSMTVNLFAGVPLASNITSTTGLICEQIDSFQPWNGDTTTNDNVGGLKYRLLGEFDLSSTSAIYWFRRATDTYRQIKNIYTVFSRSTDGVTSIIYAMYRFMPYWTEEVNDYMTASASLTSVQMVTQMYIQKTTGFELIANIGPNYNIATASTMINCSHPCREGRTRIDNIKIGGAGTSTAGYALLGYTDGGMRL